MASRPPYSPPLSSVRSPSPPPPSPIHSPAPLHLASRACGPITPVPRWKLYENPSYESLGAASAGHTNTGHRNFSARKIAASLWECQEVPSSSTKFIQEVDFPAPLTGVSVEASPCTPFEQGPSPAWTSDSSQAMKCSSKFPSGAAFQQKEASCKIQDSGVEAPQTKAISQLISNSNGHGFKEANAFSGMKHYDCCETPMEIDAAEDLASSVSNCKMQEAENQLPPDELLKALNCLRSLEEQKIASISLVSTLRMELEHAHTHVKELELTQYSARKEIGNLVRRITEERNAVRRKEEERVKAVIHSLRQEVEEEKKARGKLEGMNQRLARELSVSSKALARVVEGIERERKTTGLMEDVCDELVKEIGRDKAEVEQLKREHAETREELNEERSMLRVAETWREERVQLKLAEARLELEEKTVALSNLKFKVEQFLVSHGNDGSLEEQKIKEAEALLDAVNLLQPCEIAFPMSFPEKGLTQSTSTPPQAAYLLDHAHKSFPQLFVDRLLLDSNLGTGLSCSDNFLLHQSLPATSFSDMESNEPSVRRKPNIDQTSGCANAKVNHSPSNRLQDANELPDLGGRSYGLNRQEGDWLEELDSSASGRSVEDGSEADVYESDGKGGETDEIASAWSADCDKEDGDDEEGSSPWNNSITDEDVYYKEEDEEADVLSDIDPAGVKPFETAR